MVRALPILGPEQNSRTTGDQHEGAVPGSQSGASAEQAAAAHGGPGCAAACCQNGGGARVGRFTGFMLPAPPPSPAASSRNTAARPLQLSGATETTRGSELALLARRGAATGPTAPPTKRSNSGMLPLGGAAPVPPTVDGGPDAAAAGCRHECGHRGLAVVVPGLPCAAYFWGSTVPHSRRKAVAHRLPRRPLRWLWVADQFCPSRGGDAGGLAVLLRVLPSLRRVQSPSHHLVLLLRLRCLPDKQGRSALAPRMPCQEG